MAGKKKDEEDEGAPAWVMTFADLMSLLMCFFVLLLSFSEMDRKKYKQVAGSMKMAFGVQREIPTQESPKGVTIMAKEFAPGKPQPTLERTLRQETTDDTQDYLEVLEAIDRVQEKVFGEERGLMRGNVDAEIQDENVILGGIKIEKPSKSSSHGEGGTKGEAKGKGPGESEGKGRDGDGSGADGNGNGNGEGEGEAGMSAEAISEEAKALEEALQKALNDAQRQADALRQALKDELDQELLKVEAKEQGVLIKVRERGSFPSGQAVLNRDFLPVLEKISLALISDASDLVVGGHTDDLPISTGRFPSNWELAAGRASSVVHALISQGLVARERLEVRAFADTEPLVPNTTRANRAQNRRVEIFINTMPDVADKAVQRALNPSSDHGGAEVYIYEEFEQ
jgi:chemotaxis protein MotB